MSDLLVNSKHSKHSAMSSISDVGAFEIQYEEKRTSDKKIIINIIKNIIKTT